MASRNTKAAALFKKKAEETAAKETKATANSTIEAAETVPAEVAPVETASSAATSMISSLEKRMFQKSDKVIDITLLEDHPDNFFAITEENLSIIKSSIRENGMIESPTVRRHPTKAGAYQILAGHTRIKACRLIIDEINEELKSEEITPEKKAELEDSLKRVKAIKVSIVNTKSDDEAEAILIATNIQKRNPTSAERSKSAYKAAKIYKASKEYEEKGAAGLAEYVGYMCRWGRSTAYMWNKIINIDETIFDKLVEKGLTMNCLNKVSGFSKEELELLVAKKIDKTAITTLDQMSVPESFDEVLAVVNGEPAPKIAKVKFEKAARKSRKDNPVLVFVNKDKEADFKARLQALCEEFGAYPVDIIGK